MLCFEGPTFIASFDDFAMMGQPIGTSYRHFGVTEHLRAFRER
ncbi:MAG: hypothetical protein RL186_504 [Pseudomonadota bacterium]